MITSPSSPSRGVRMRDAKRSDLVVHNLQVRNTARHRRYGCLARRKVTMPTPRQLQASLVFLERESRCIARFRALIRHRSVVMHSLFETEYRPVPLLEFTATAGAIIPSRRTCQNGGSRRRVMDPPGAPEAGLTPLEYDVEFIFRLCSETVKNNTLPPPSRFGSLVRLISSLVQVSEGHSVLLFASTRKQCQIIATRLAKRCSTVSFPLNP